jgi:heme exporter protein C
MRNNWWKILSSILLIYTFTAGFLVPVPHIGNLYETIRNLFFHVPMWFAQLTLITISGIYAIRYLRKPNPTYDLYSLIFAQTGILFGCLGLVTGAIWANYTWGAPWNNDPKQLGAAIALLIYLAYFVLRNSVTDMDKRGRIAAVYNIFAYFIYVPMIMILPRLTESLHPGGKGEKGNPGLNGADLDPAMRMVFWPAVAGWILLGVWICTLFIRYHLITEKRNAHVS